MNKFYTSTTKADALAMQEKLRVAKNYPCCQCHVKPDADCPCDDHRRPDGTILPGPHSPESCAMEAVDVSENPNTKGEFFVSVPAEFEKHLVLADRAKMIEKPQAAVDVAIADVAVEKLVDESPIDATPIDVIK